MPSTATSMKLKPTFDCPTDKIDAECATVDCTELALAVKITKDYLTGKGFSPTIVRRQRNGRFKVQTNVITFLVAHSLGVLSIPVQEME